MKINCQETGHAIHLPLVTKGQDYKAKRLATIGKLGAKVLINNGTYLDLMIREGEHAMCEMLVDTGSQITILKINSLHSDTTIYCGEENKLKLAGISDRTNTIREMDCHIKINDKITEHTIHIVPLDFQVHADGIIGIDLLAN